MSHHHTICQWYVAMRFIKYKSPCFPSFCKSFSLLAPRSSDAPSYKAFVCVLFQLAIAMATLRYHLQWVVWRGQQRNAVLRDAPLCHAHHSHCADRGLQVANEQGHGHRHVCHVCHILATQPVAVVWSDQMSWSRILKQSYIDGQNVLFKLQIFVNITNWTVIFSKEHIYPRIHGQYLSRCWIIYRNSNWLVQWIEMFNELHTRSTVQSWKI